MKPHNYEVTLTTDDLTFLSFLKAFFSTSRRHFFHPVLHTHTRDTAISPNATYAFIKRKIRRSDDRKRFILIIETFTLHEVFNCYGRHNLGHLVVLKPHLMIIIIFIVVILIIMDVIFSALYIQTHQTDAAYRFVRVCESTAVRVSVYRVY